MMQLKGARSPEWLVDIADALLAYLREAADLPSPVEDSIWDGGPPRWYVQAPHSAAVGRTPWINMANIIVGCIGETIVLTFQWKLNREADTYILPMTTLRADPMTGSDALITRLDFFLGSPTWQERHSTPIGNRTRVVAMPPKESEAGNSLSGER